MAKSGTVGFVFVLRTSAEPKQACSAFGLASDRAWHFYYYGKSENHLASARTQWHPMSPRGHLHQDEQKDWEGGWGLLLMFAVIAKLPEAIKAGRSIKIKKDDLSFEVTGKD